MSAPTLLIRDANLTYQKTTLFSNFDLEIPGGCCTCLVGPSGVGKTSLVRLIAGLKTSATSHQIASSDGSSVQARISYLAQDETLLPWRTVLENIYIGYILRGEGLTHEAKERALALLQQVELEHYQAYYPSQLSGGMKKRVLLARTLFEDKPIILLDEPFASLDVITRTRIQELASNLLAGRTVLLVTHDPLEALRMGHHVYVMAGKPASITAKIDLPGSPPRQLTDNALIEAHAKLLDELSHAKGAMAG